MDMQADIKWIQEELEKLQDQSLIDTLKQMIQYGKEQKEELLTDAQKKELDRRIQKIDEDKAKFYSLDDVEDRLSKHL